MNTAAAEWTERVAARNAIDLEADAPRASQPEGGAK
jgi:hypothetical protein